MCVSVCRKTLKQYSFRLKLEKNQNFVSVWLQIKKLFFFKSNTIRNIIRNIQLYTGAQEKHFLNYLFIFNYLSKN